MSGLAARQRAVRGKHLRYHHRCRCHRPLQRGCACGLRQRQRPQGKSGVSSEGRSHQLPVHGAHDQAPPGIKEIRQNLEAQLGFNASLPALYSEADMEQMIQLLDDGVTDDSEKSLMRGSSAISDDECED